VPSGASFRREAATAAGAIEAAIRAVEALRDCAKCGLNKKDARFLLDMALRALQRLALGHEPAGKTRRERAASARRFPPWWALWKRVSPRTSCSKSSRPMPLAMRNAILMGQREPEGDGKADPALTFRTPAAAETVYSQL